MLTDDVTSIGDGGGKVPARTTLLSVGLAVARFLQRGLFMPTAPNGIWWAAASFSMPGVNGGPGVVAVLDDPVRRIMALDVRTTASRHLTQVTPTSSPRATRHWSLPSRGTVCPMVTG